MSLALDVELSTRYIGAFICFFIRLSILEHVHYVKIKASHRVVRDLSR